jgi:hypothetical protein
MSKSDPELEHLKHFGKNFNNPQATSPDNTDVQAFMESLGAIWQNDLKVWMLPGGLDKWVGIEQATFFYTAFREAQRQAVTATVDHICQLASSKPFGEWTQKDIAAFFQALGDYERSRPNQDTATEKEAQ